jgi:GT2 family glycosyltransferase/glycosyltransferase involved in cell wall biosynthesis
LTGPTDMSTAATVGLYDPVSPEVSIIILNLNKSALTATCLRALWARTTGRRYEIIVVDNGSDPHEFHLLERIYGDFRLVRLPINRFFGEGNNVGVQASRGKYLVFLNNDAFVTENWLEPLIDALEREPQAGGAGPKFLYPGGRVQEAGGFVRADGIVIQRGKLGEMTTDELEHTTIVDYCSAACFATTRELFDRVGGFDGNFEPAYYEDTDLCFKIASLDRFIYYCHRSVVEHVENATAGAMIEELGLYRTIEINKAKFSARWGGYLNARVADPDAPMPPLAPARSRQFPARLNTAPIAVFHTRFDLAPGGGERYLLSAAAALRGTHRVYVATGAPYSDYRLDFLARELSLDLDGISLTTYDDLWKLGAIDIFVHLGNLQLPFVPPRGRRNFHVCQFPFPTDDAHNAVLWNNFEGYDSVIVYSRFVHAAYVARLNAFRFDADIHVLAPPVPLPNAATLIEKQGGPLQIVSIGRFFVGFHNKRHDIMIKALQQLTAEGVDAELHLIGSIPPHPTHLEHFAALTRIANDLPIRFHPNASPERVNDLLARASVYWHATGFEIDPRLRPDVCEHFGISIVEAMGHGCVPFVVANGGPVEFVREGDTGFHYDTIDELVGKTLRLAADRPALASVSQRARAESRRFSESIFAQRVRDLIAG